MKKKINSLDATPSKEIFRSIVVDYDLKLGICELIDNAIDLWNKSGSVGQLNISLKLDSQQQKITVTDNAGGIKESDILLFVSPGRTGNTAKEETIGLFGVGSKRAVVALAQEIKVTTRNGSKRTHQVEFNDEWLKEDSWGLDIFEVPNIEKNTTTIELLGLRSKLNDDSIERLKNHISSTYALFLKRGNLEIAINDKIISGIEYDSDWSYPPGYEPVNYKLDLVVEGEIVKVEIVGGVISESASKGGESGVYFYCNERLIAKALKDYEVGYVTGMAGQPNHPGAALGRVIVKLQGQAQFMPWNSSKSAINYQHKVFEALRVSISNAISYFVGLSRRTQGDWPGQIYKYKTGTIREELIEAPEQVSNLYNVPLPRTRKRYDEKLVDKNKRLGKRKPWVVGLYEAIAAVDFLTKRNLKQKNRLALILLDSNLEIALKEYLVHEASIGMRKFNGIANNRSDVIREVQALVPSIPTTDWSRINYYYLMRNNLIHQRTTAAVSDTDIEEYREIVQKVLKELFDLKF